MLRFRVLGASFSSVGCFIFEIWVLRASVFVFETIASEALDFKLFPSEFNFFLAMRMTGQLDPYVVNGRSKLTSQRQFAPVRERARCKQGQTVLC